MLRHSNALHVSVFVASEPERWGFTFATLTASPSDVATFFFSFLSPAVSVSIARTSKFSHLLRLAGNF